jgi:membrane-associated phospholipid phosphatase
VLFIARTTRAQEFALPHRPVVIPIAAVFLLASGTLSPAHARQLLNEGAQRDIPAAYAALFAPEPEPQPAIVPLEQAASTAQVPTEPQHTGFSALVHSTASDFVAFPKRKSTWVILGVGAAAAALVHPIDDNVNDYLQDATGLRRAFKPGKYLGYGWVQGGAAVGLYVIGRYAMEPEAGTHTNKISHLGFDLLRANLLTQAFTYGIKYAVRRDRPTGECCAFPSGHASVTFATASVLERHFGYRASWPMFVIAGYVSASRLTDNRHFLSDVVFGSALGMATGWTVVGRHGRENFTLFPAPVRGGVVLAGSWTPGRRTPGAN